MRDQAQRRLQFNLRSVFALTFAVGALLTLMRLLGPDARLAGALLVTAAIGAAIGRGFGHAMRGVALGLLLPIAYILSIEFFFNLGRRLRWPGASLRAWEMYSAIWYGPIRFGSGRFGTAVVLWEYWCEDMGRRFGTRRPPDSWSALAVLLVCGAMLLVRRFFHGSYVLPAGVIAFGIALVTARDFDAALIGFVVGGFGAMLMNRQSSRRPKTVGNE